MKRIIGAFLATAFVLGTFGATAIADVEPGDEITSANKDKVKGLIPDELYPYVIDNYKGLNMKIVASHDFTPHQKYVEATVKYACQATVDERGVLQNFTAGEPFPYSKWAQEATNHACDLSPDDPQFGIKIGWNYNYRWQGGAGLNLPHWGFSWMRNSGKEMWRLGQGEYRRTYFSHRADLLPETHQLEDGTEVEWAEFFDVKTPFDLRGTMFLLYRYVTDKEDDTWAYIPALRRVRRVAATQKSDSLLGTEFSLEDFYGFAGYTWDQKWEYQGTTTKLAAFGGGPGEHGRKCWNNIIPEDDQQLEGMPRLGTSEEWQHCSFGPYNAMTWNGETWQKREAIQVDIIPLQKGHPYSRRKFWIDRETYTPMYFMAYDRAGQPYKILNGGHRWSEDSINADNKGKRTLNYSFIAIVNVQNNVSHNGQFDNASSPSFSVADSRKYYDTTRLKRQGR